MMTQKNLLGLSFIAGATVVLSAGSAQALIITAQTDTPFSTVAGAQTITFDNVALGSLGNGGYSDPSGVSYSGIGGDIVQNNGYGYAAPPSQLGYDSQDNPYLTVGSSNRSDLVIDFGVDSDYFGFYFGSIDTYNNLQFFNNDELIASLTGADIRAQANGDRSVNGARFVNIFAEEGENFDKIVFQSDARAFETDNHAYRVADPVPTPAAVLPVLSGLFASAKRRKQRNTDEV